MSNRRRLSRGNVASALVLEDDDADYSDSENKNVNVNQVGTGSRRKSLGTRRRSRSSFGGIKAGGSPKKGSAEQARLADMYKTIIKMSSENKITTKNSWNLDLIDHMGSMIREEAAADKTRLGVNFQKASCTLDASIKIYANRVDDTWSSSFRVLENLSRNGHYEDEDDDNENQAGEGTGKGTSKVGSKNTSKRLGLTDTIERNPETLNEKKLENDYAVDPMFHKMSLAFDEGGAKGMLMTNLRVAKNSSTITFSDDVGKVDGVDALTAATPPSPVSTAALKDIDITDLVEGFEGMDVSSVPVCPTINYYRECVGVDIGDDFLGIIGKQAEEVECSPCDVEFTATDEEENGVGDDLADYDNGIGEHSDGNDFTNEDDGGIGEEDGTFNDKVRFSPSGSPTSSVGDGRTAGDIQWGAVFGEEEEAGGTPEVGDSAMMGNFVDELDHETDGDAAMGAAPIFTVPAFDISSGNDYSFFGQEAMSRVANSWAGSKHWKFATRHTRASKKKQEQLKVVEEGEGEEFSSGSRGREQENTVDQDQDQDQQITSKGTTMKKDKVKFSFDFKLEWIPEDFEKFTWGKPSRTGTDKTTLTAAAVQKALDAAEEGALLLPPDAKLELKDLFRLFLQPQMLAPHKAMARVTEESTATAPVGHVKASEKDFIWGKAAAVGADSRRASIVQLDINDDEDDEGRGFDEGFADADGNDFVDDPMDEASVGEETRTLGEGALAINMAGMVQADRTVDKVNIGYAKIAKRVNVRKLKTDLWGYLDAHCKESEWREEKGSEHAHSDVERKDFGFDVTTTTGTSEGVEASDHVSFQQSISDIARVQKQKEVTLPFYFICLLHLANDKTLKIEAQDNLADLVISKDD